jgi:hypothetical protein
VTPVETRTRQPYAKAFAWGGIWLAILTIGFSVAYGNFSAEGFGRFVGMTAIPAIVVGFQASRSKSVWSFWKIGGIYFLAAIAVWLVSSYGAMQHR